MCQVQSLRPWGGLIPVWSNPEMRRLGAPVIGWPFCVASGAPKGRAGAKGGSLIALATEEAQIKVVFVGNLLVESGDAVITVAELCAGTEEVKRLSKQASNGTASRSRP